MEDKRESLVQGQKCDKNPRNDMKKQVLAHQAA